MGGTIYAMRSVDGGKDWNFISEVFNLKNEIEKRREKEEVTNAFPLQLPGGRVLVAFRHHTYYKNKEGKIIRIIYRIEVYYSDNFGKEWHFLSKFQGETPIWEPFLFKASKNSPLQMYYAREIENYEQDIVMRESYDDGETWGEPRVVSHTAGRRDGMPSVIELSRGTIFVVFESLSVNSDDEHPALVVSVISRDGGKSWGEKRVIVSPRGKGNAYAPFATRVGTMALVTYMFSESGETWPENCSLNIALSGADPTAEGIEWGTATLTEDCKIWPAVFSFSHDGRGRILFTYNTLFPGVWVFEFSYPLWEEGVNIPGNDVDVISGLSQEECFSFCEGTPGATWCVWRNDKTCWAKSESSSPIKEEGIFSTPLP